MCRNGSQYMRQMSVISGHPISTGFRRLTGCQRDPRARGVTVSSSNSSTFLQHFLLCCENLLWFFSTFVAIEFLKVA